MQSTLSTLKEKLHYGSDEQWELGIIIIIIIILAGMSEAVATAHSKDFLTPKNDEILKAKKEEKWTR